jgi:hypothetical protein
MANTARGEGLAVWWSGPFIGAFCREAISNLGKPSRCETHLHPGNEAVKARGTEPEGVTHSSVSIPGAAGRTKHQAGRKLISGAESD